MSQSLAYQYALNNQGLDAMYDSIRDFMNTGPTPDQIRDAMATYGVSPDDIVAATGSSGVTVVTGYTEQGTDYYVESIYNVAPPQETYTAPEPVVTPPPAPVTPTFTNPLNNVQQVTTPATTTPTNNNTFVAGPTSPTVVGPTPPASNTTVAPVTPVNPNLVLAGSLDQSQGYTPPGVTKPVLIKDADGNEYNKDTLLKLAGQVAQNLDTSKSSGGAYGTNKETIGFGYDTLSSTYGKDFSSGDQIAFDIARQLLTKGITDYSEVKSLVPTTVTETVPEGETGFTYSYDRTAYINPKTGQEVSTWLGATYTGEGGTQYNIDYNTGKFYTEGSSSNDLDGGLGLVLSIGASFLLPGVGSLIAAELGVSQAIGTAIAQAGFQSAMGADSKNILLGLALGPIGQEITGLNAAGAVSTNLSSLISDPAILSLATNAVVAAGTTLLATGGNTNAALNSAAGSVVNTVVTNLTGSSAIGAGASSLASGGNSESAISSLLNTAAYNAGVENRDSVVNLFTGVSSNTASTLLNTANTISSTGNVDVLGDFINTLDAVTNTGNSQVIDNYVNATANIATSNNNDQLSTFNSTTNNVIVSSNGNTSVLDTFVNSAGNAAISGDLSVYDQILNTFNDGANIVANIANTYGPGYQVAVDNTGNVVISDAGGGVVQNVGSSTGTTTPVDTTPTITAKDLTGDSKTLYDDLETQWSVINEQISNNTDQDNSELISQARTIIQQQEAIVEAAKDPEQAANLNQFIQNNAPVDDPEALASFRETYGLTDQQIANAQRLNEIKTQQFLQQQQQTQLDNLQPGQFYNGIGKDSLSPTGYINIDGNAVNRDGSLFSGPVMPGQETNVNISNLNLGGQTFDVTGGGPVNPGTTIITDSVLGDANVTGPANPSDVTRDVFANNVTGGTVTGTPGASTNTGSITANNITFQDLAGIISNNKDITANNANTGNITNVTSTTGNVSLTDSTTGNVSNANTTTGTVIANNATTGNISDSTSTTGNILINTGTTGNVNNVATVINNANINNTTTGNVSSASSIINNLTANNTFTTSITDSTGLVNNAIITNSTVGNLNNVTGTTNNATILNSTGGNGNIILGTGTSNGNVIITGPGTSNGNIIVSGPVIPSGNIVTGNANIVANVPEGNIVVSNTTSNNAIITTNTIPNTNVVITTNTIPNTNVVITTNTIPNTNVVITTNTIPNGNVLTNANVLTNVFIPNTNANVTTNTFSNLANISNIGNITFNTGGLNPGYIEPPTFYNATSPVQSQYYWGDRPYQPGPTFNEVLYNTAPNAPQTPFGLQQMAEPLTGDQINQIAMGRTVIPNNMRMPVNPYDWSKDYNSNNVPMAPVGVVLPTIQTSGPVVPNRATSTSVDPRYADVSKQLGANWFNKQQAAAQAGDWDTYNQITQQVGSILNPVIDKP